MLSDLEIRNLKPKKKQYLKRESEYLYLSVFPSGAKSWYFRYKKNKGYTTKSIGSYPRLTLTEARKKRDTLLDEFKQTGKISVLNSGYDFNDIANSWLKQQNHLKSKKRVTKYLEYINDEFNGRTVDKITASDILYFMRKVENKKTYETAKRLLSTLSRIFTYAIVCEKATIDPTYGLNRHLVKVPKKNYSFITDPQKMGHLLAGLDDYEGTINVKNALKLIAYTFMRSSEARLIKWTEIKNNQIIIPDNRTKSSREHIVPLSIQSQEIIKEMRLFNSNKPYVFSSNYSKNKPISDNGLLQGIRRLGYSKEEQSVHGFRHFASTQLNEQGFDADAIELQLSHVTGGVRGVYNKAQKLEYRTQMMQEWADYLDKLKQNSNKK